VRDCNAALGYIPAVIVDHMPWTKEWLVDKERKRVTFMFERKTDSKVEDCSTSMAEFLQSVRDQKSFQVLEGWRGELYPIYGPGRELLLNMERSATPLFGVVTYGVHMTAFVQEGQNMKIWVPKRAKTKQTYPGMMDNTVAGGLTTGEQPFNCLIREAQEEASLPETVVRSTKSCGTLTYFYVRDARAGGETGLCQPECQYLYDLELPPETIPTPGDNEAVDFQLLSVKQVQEALAAGMFKPNCAVVLLEFFVRHGILTAENEPDYIEIVARLHRRLEFPTA
jgi:8-oxo-dGTP pyrophosphatase MutT (NUDIX family)